MGASSCERAPSNHEPPIGMAVVGTDGQRQNHGALAGRIGFGRNIEFNFRLDLHGRLGYPAFVNKWVIFAHDGFS
jgi:hypothetical protein